MGGVEFRMREVRTVNRDGLFRIGEMAQSFHVSVSILRYYEKIGLLNPEYIDAETGYRYYSTRQFETLNTIRYLRRLGLPLSEISAFVNNRSLEDIRRLLELQRTQVRERITELAAVESRIENRLRQIDRAKNVGLGIITEETLPASRLAVLNRSINPENSYELELAIRELEGRDDRAAVFLGKIGVGISADSFQRGVFRPCDFLFMVLEENEEHSGTVIELPERPGVSIRFGGGHEKAGPSYGALFDYFNANRLTAAGPVMEITVIDYGLTRNESEFLTEIRIPVQ